MTLSAAWPARRELPAEARRSDLRAALLTHPLVEDALLTLDEKRAAIVAKGQWPGADPHYSACIALTARNLRVFGWDEVDYWVSVVRERMESGIWGLSFPVGDGPSGSQSRQRARSVAEPTITAAAAYLAHRLDAARRRSREPADAEAAAELGCAPATVRKRLSRAMALFADASGVR